MMNAPAETTSHRPPGRPRSARADLAILESTLESFIDEGFKGMSMDGIAARAGVGKATIYRRWSSKEQLLVDAISTLGDALEPADTGTLKGDLVATFTDIIQRMEQSKAGRCMQRLLGEMRDSPELVATYRRRVIEPRRRAVQDILQRSIDRGELDPGTDLDVAIDMLVGPIVFRKMIGALDASNAGEFITRLVGQALQGLQAIPSQSGEVTAPSPRLLN